MHMQRLARSAWLRGPQALAAAALVAGLAACGHAAPPDPAPKQRTRPLQARGET